MPIEVDVPNLGIVEFPDNTSEDEMQNAITGHLQSEAFKTVKPTPLEQAKLQQFKPEELPPAVAPPPESILKNVKLSPYEQAQVEYPEDYARAQLALGKDPERLRQMGEQAMEALHGVTKPIAEVVPKITKEPLQRLLTMASPTTTAAVMRQRSLAGEPIRDIKTPESEKFIGKVVGVEQSLADTANFFTSPLGIATLGMGALPKAAQMTISAAFTADMARQLPGIYDELQVELKKPENERDYEKISYLTTTAATTMGFTAMGAFHALGKGYEIAKPSIELGVNALAGGKSLMDLSGLTPEEIARRGTLPSEAQFTAKDIPEVNAPPGMAVSAPGIPIPEAFQVEPLRRAVESMTPEGVAETRRQAEMRAFEARIKGIKPPKPEVPETPIEELEKNVLRPEELAPAKAPETYEDFLQDLKKKVTPETTYRDVQQMYPNAFSREGVLVNKEGAKKLLNDARGVQQAQQPAQPVREPLPTELEYAGGEMPKEGQVSTPTKWLRDNAQNFETKMSNNDTVNIGKSLRDVSDLDEVLDVYRNLKSDLESQKALPAEEKVKSLEKRLQLTVRQQIVKEIVDFATNTGSWVEGEGTISHGIRPLDWKTNTKVANWLKEHAEELGIPLPEELAKGKQVQAEPTATVPSLLEFPPKEIPSGEIAVKPDLMQFRQGAIETGETPTGKILGKWDELKAGTLLLWEPTDPAAYGLKPGEKYIIANGHHRFAFGKTQNVKAHAAQVIRESDGYSAQDARRIAAEINIADDKGTIHDQVKYLRNAEGARGPDEEMAARERIGAKGRKAATIAFDASDDVYSAFINERITPEQAEAIAAAAPKNAAAQSVGLKFAERVKDPESLRALVKRYLEEPAASQRTEGDLFGYDDAAIRKMMDEEAKAKKFQDDIRETINAIRGASKRSEIAKREGIDIKDPEAIAKRVEFLRGELERWKEWWKHNDLAEKVRGPKRAEPTAAPETPAPQPPPVVEPPSGQAQPPAQEPQPSPTPAPGEKPPTPPGAPPSAPVTPDGKPIVPTGHFDKPSADNARDRLRQKRQKEQDRLQSAAEEKLVIRPEAEREEIQAAAEEPTGELFPGEKKEEPLFEQATLRDLTTIGGEHVEKGVITYPDFYKAMVNDVGPEFKRYFRRAYNQLRDVDSLRDVTRFFTSREEVELYNDDGVKVGKGAERRPGLIVRNEELMPKSEEHVNPTTWIGPEGDSIDWTQTRAINLGLDARYKGNPAIMIADGPGVGKSGIGAGLAHMLTYLPKISLDVHMGGIWKNATPEFKAKLFFGETEPAGGAMPEYKDVNLDDIILGIGREYSGLELERMANLSWDNIRPEKKAQIYKRYGFRDQQIKENNVNAGATERKKVLIVGTSKQHIETSFKPDFEKFGIPMENVEFITYTTLSNPGAEGTPQRKAYDKIMDQEWGAVIFDEAHALKNAGSNREHSSRKFKTPFKVFMTATPMDNVPNAVYFFSEITGKTKDQILDQLGLRRLVKIVNGEGREYVVQKPGISTEDVKQAIIKLREEAIRGGLMVRREFPWWGDVIGREREVSLYKDMEERWNGATSDQKAEWISQSLWDNSNPPERARMLLPSYAEGKLPEYPNPMSEVQASSREFSPAELERVSKLSWDALAPEQKAKVFNNSLYNMSWAELPDPVRKEVYNNADYTPQELERGIRVKKGMKGPYFVDRLTDVEAAEQQKIIDSWEKAVEKSTNPMTRRNLRGQEAQELKRWTEYIKAKHTIPLILKELEAGRNVVVYGNTVNPHYVKGLGDSGVWANVKGQPNMDWPQYPGGLGYIAGELERMRVPFSQIFGPIKDMKTIGIRDFYANRKRVALVTPQSGGAGLNLDDVIGRYPRTLIVSDINWAGDLFEQLMYRVSRRNTASESKAHVLMVPNAVSDATIMRNMNKKLAVLRGIQAGKDTDLANFLDDLNNPEVFREQSFPTPEKDLDITPFPDVPWEEVRGRTGKLRWKTPFGDEIGKWWFANGEEKNPLGLRLDRTGFGPRFWKIWSNAKPDWAKPKGKDIVDPELQESNLGGYQGDPKYSDVPFDYLLDDIRATEDLIDRGFEVSKNQDKLDQMKAEMDRRLELDERVQDMLFDEPEYQDLLQKLDEFPDHPLSEHWRLQMDQIVSDTMAEAEGTIAEPQAATVGPNGAIPSTVIPKSLVAPKNSMYDIARKLRKGIGIPFRYKSWIGGGFFDPLLNYIRIKRSNDFPAMLHEAGHALDNQFHFWKNPSVMNELNILGDPATPGSRSSWRPNKSQKYKLAEGVAEFVRYWSFDPAKATAMAPNMEKLWNSILDANEKELGFMREIRDDIQIYQKSPEQAKLRSMIKVDNPQRGKFTFSKLVENLFDDMHFLKLASDDAFTGKKSDLMPSQDAYILFRLLRGNYGRADAWVRYGTIDAKTGDIKYGKSLSNALEPVRSDLDNFRDYIVAREARNMIRRGQDPGIEPSTIKAVVDQYDGNANFQEAFNRIQEWNESLLRYAVDTGFLTELDYKRIKDAHAEYIPMRRIYEVGIGEQQSYGGAGTGRQLGKRAVPSSLRIRKGSQRQILDPLGSLVENAYFLTFAAEKNRALQALADYSTIPGMGKWIGPYSTPKEKIRFHAGKIKKQLKDAGIDVTGLDDDLLMTFWRESQRETLKDNVIRVRRGGKNEYYQLDPDLYRSVMAMDKFAIDGWLKIMAYPAQVLRAGVTADPTFALYRNIVRDTVNAAVVSKYTTLPFEAAIRGTFALTGQNVAKKLGFKDVEAMFGSIAGEWKAAGGAHSVESAFYDRDVMKKFIKDQVTNNPAYWKRGLYWATSPLLGLRALTAVGEQATRIGEYQKVFNSLLKEGWSRKDAHLQAAFESRDLQDFAMTGSSPAIKVAKILTAFFNAGLQGRYKFIRSLYDRRTPDAWKRVLMKGFGYITMAKLLEQYINWDNEDYWAQPRWQRMVAFHIPIGKNEKTGQTNFMLVPVPFESGLIFATMPGMIMEYYKQRNVDAATAFGSHFSGQMVDNPVPQWIMTALELVPDLGYDFYQNRPILNRGMESEPYEFRYTDTTSTLAKKAGSFFNIAPAKIEHALRRTTGGIGSTVVHHGIDKLIELGTGEPGAPLPANPLRTMFTQERGPRSQIVDDFYKKLQMLKMEYTARTKHQKFDKGIALAELPYMLEAEKMLSNIRKQYQGSRDMELRYKLSKRMEDIARRWVRNPNGRYKSAKVKAAQ